jgi:RNA polymerase subunit RPABC4/transcription elongation factor Spt4
MDLFRKISETVSKGVSTATEKAQQTVEISRLHSQITVKRKEIDKLFTDIGEAVFDAYLAKDLSFAEPRVIPVCEQVAAIRHEIEDLGQRIMRIRNEKECVCGNKVPFDTRFCPSCGHRFPEPPVEPEPQVAEPIESQDEDEAPTASDWSDVGRALPLYGTEEEPVEEGHSTQASSICPACGTTVDAGSRYCPSCGTPNAVRN